MEVLVSATVTYKGREIEADREECSVYFKTVVNIDSSEPKLLSCLGMFEFYSWRVSGCQISGL